MRFAEADFPIRRLYYARRYRNGLWGYCGSNVVQGDMGPRLSSAL